MQPINSIGRLLKGIKPCLIVSLRAQFGKVNQFVLENRMAIHDGLRQEIVHSYKSINGSVVKISMEIHFGWEIFQYLVVILECAGVSWHEGEYHG